MIDDLISCPFCQSSDVKRLEAIVTSRFIADPAGGPAVEMNFPLCRCLDCGRNFDEIGTEDRKPVI